MQIMPNTNILADNINRLKQNENIDERLKEDKRLKEVCQDFEAIFIHMMLKSGRSTVDEGGLVEKSNGTKMFEDMHDQELATIMSKSDDGGMGISKMLYEQMKKGLNHQRANIKVEEQVIE